MSTFSEFKDEILAHNASNQWVDSNTNANDIYWKLLYSNSGYINKIANYPDTDEIKTSLTKLSKIISTNIYIYPKQHMKISLVIIKQILILSN